MHVYHWLPPTPFEGGQGGRGAQAALPGGEVDLHECNRTGGDSATQDREIRSSGGPGRDTDKLDVMCAKTEITRGAR